MKGVSDTIEISREYFDQIDKITTELDIFVRDTLLKSRRVLRKVHKDPYYGYRFDDLKEYEIFVKIFVMKDLCHLYKELNGSVGINEIESKGWALTPSKYIEFIDHDLDIDYEKEMARIQTEMKEILCQEKKSQQMLEDAFKGIGYGIE